MKRGRPSKHRSQSTNEPTPLTAQERKHLMTMKDKGFIEPESPFGGRCIKGVDGVWRSVGGSW